MAALTAPSGQRWRRSTRRSTRCGAVDHVQHFVDAAIGSITRRQVCAHIVVGVRGPSAAVGEATIEVLVIGLDKTGRSHSLISELGSLHQREVIRVVDALVVNRESDQTINASANTQLSPDEAEQFRHLMRDAIGFQPDNRGLGPGLHWQGGTVPLTLTAASFLAESRAPG